MKIQNIFVKKNANRNIEKENLTNISINKLRFMIYFFRCLKYDFLRFIYRRSDRYRHLSLRGNVNLGDFCYNENLAKPRGVEVNQKFYSYGYSIDFIELPDSIKKYVFELAGIIEHYFGCDFLINKPNVWRNYHIDEANYGKDIFSECFHQDLVRGQYNLQLFILLHETTDEHGPFEFLSHEEQSKNFNYYKYRDKIKPFGSSNKLIGSRGDTLLFSTGYTLHKAGNPKLGQYRDILSLAFFPSYTGIGVPMSMEIFETKNG